jgi:dolichyl-phosphate beta-glucosyltransferase
MSDFDIAIGLRSAGSVPRRPAYRHWGGRLINLAIRVLILPGLQDTQCGFKCFTAAAAERLFPRQTLTGWSFDIELLYLARRDKMRIREIPIHWYYDPDSKVRAVKDALKMLQDILRIRLNALRGCYD